jgi:soluble lytic murein transglycosylase-like protein
MALRVLIMSALAVLAINGAVILAGGDPNPLSPLYLREKVGALAALGRHMALHPLRDCADPREQIPKAARDHRVPTSLLASMAEAESGMQPHRISRAGAMGVMQLMPATAARYGVTDPFDPTQNVSAAARYVAWLLRRYGGDQRRVAAAYNAGPGRVPRHGALGDLPGETLTYMRRVAGR